MNKDSVVVATVHFDAEPGQYSANMNAFEQLARQARSKGARLVSGYERCLDACVLVKDRSDTRLIEGIRARAETIPGPRTERLCALAGEIDAHLAIGMTENSGDHYYNAAVLAGPDGTLLAVHRKTQCPVVPNVNDEGCIFSEGNALEVCETEFATLGMLICYERRFPENARLLAFAGAEIVLCLSAGFNHRQDIFRAQARAEVKGVFFIHASRGQGLVVGPSGNVIAQGPAADEQVPMVLAQLDRSLLEASSARRQRYFEHRRPDLYNPIAEPR